MEPQQLMLYIWESAVEKRADGSVTLRPKVPLSQMSAAQAGRVLGLGRDRIYDLYQAGLLDGYKPGAVAVRSDGRKSNAALRLDSESVLRYRARQLELARLERCG